MIIAEESSVTLYGDAMAFLMILGIFILSKRVRSKRDTGIKLFSFMGLNVMLASIWNSICYALHDQTFSWCRPVELIAKTLLELSILFLVYQWLLYVDYKLHGSRDRLLRHFWGYYIPIQIFVIILILNLFTGIVFTITDDMRYTPTIVYWIMEIMEYFYILLSGINIYINKKRTGKNRFFRFNPVILPILIGTLFTIFTKYSASSLGVAVGLTFLYFSLIDTWKYEDSQTGFYNKAYLDHILELKSSGRYSFNSIITFEAGGDALAFSRILNDELPKDSEIISVGSGRFLFLTESENRSTLEALSALVRESAEEYDAAHPGAEVFPKISYEVHPKL